MPPRNNSQERLRRQQYTTGLFESFNKPREEAQQFGAGLDTSLAKKLQILQAVQQYQQRAREMNPVTNPQLASNFINMGIDPYTRESLVSKAFDPYTGAEREGFYNPTTKQYFPTGAPKSTTQIGGFLDELLQSGAIAFQNGELMLRSGDDYIPIQADFSFLPDLGAGQLDPATGKWITERLIPETGETEKLPPRTRLSSIKRRFQTPFFQGSVGMSDEEERQLSGVS